jgi:hypothetical protein
MEAKTKELPVAPEPEPAAREFYRRSLEVARRSGIPFLIGGAYALGRYTGVVRDTKDLDLYILPDQARPMLAAFAAAGFKAEMVFSHWLAKAYLGDQFVDLIFGEGNGLAPVDQEWFDLATPDRLLGQPVKLAPIEEMIRSKAFIMERERYDGADVAHLIRARGRSLDWKRLLDRFGPHWRVLLAHLVMFGFVFPSERSVIPGWLLEELTERLRKETAGPDLPERLCQGTLVSRQQYLIDIHRWGYRDPRLQPEGRLTREEIDRWTEAIGRDR